MHIALLGPPGSGKDELSKKIAAEYQFPVITEKTLLSDAAAGQSELGKLAKETLAQRRSASDELLLALLRIRMDKPDVKKGFTLVDFPHSTNQADLFDGIMKGLGMAVDLVLQIEVNSDDLMERLVGQSYCRKCGAEYNLYVNPPMVEGVCDVCGSRVCCRPADYEENISNQLRVYEMDMVPVLEYFESHSILKAVDGNKDSTRIWKDVHRLIKSTTPIQVEPPPKRKGSTKGQEELSASMSGGESLDKARGKSTKKMPVAKKSAAKKKTAKQVSKKAASKKKAVAKKKVVKKAVKKLLSKKRTPPKKAAPKKKAVAKKSAAKKKVVKKVAKKVLSKKKTPPKKVAPKKKAVAKKTTKKTAVKKKARRK